MLLKDLPAGIYVNEYAGKWKDSKMCFSKTLGNEKVLRVYSNTKIGFNGKEVSYAHSTALSKDHILRSVLDE